MTMNKIQKIFVTIVGLLIATASWAAAVTVKVNSMSNGAVVASAGGQSTSPTTSPITVSEAAVVTLAVTPGDGFYLSTLTATPFGVGGESRGFNRAAIAPVITSTIPITPATENTYTFIIDSINFP